MSPSSSRSLSFSSLLLLGALLCGCPEAPASSGDAAAEGAKPKAGAIKIKNGAGKVAYRIKVKSDGYKISDAKSKERFRVKLKKTALKVKDPQDKVVAYVNTDGKKFKIKDPKGKAVLFVLRRQADGDWKLETGKDKLVCKLKKRKYGWEAKTGAGKELYKAKLKSGKTSLRDAKDATQHYTKSSVKTLAFACLGLPQLSEAQRLGLMLLVQKTKTP